MNLAPADVAMVNMDPGVTPLQGRVCFHQERLFRSTGTGAPAHRRFLDYAADEGLPCAIAEMSAHQCVRALELIERACRREGMQNFRDVNTGWRELAARA